MTDQEKRELETLRAENARLKAQSNSRVTVKLIEARAAGTNGPDDKGAKGGTIGVYGLGRFPVCLYAEQWESLLADPVVAQIRKLAKTAPRKGQAEQADNSKQASGF